ncbi:MAG: hypothetical protein GC192_13295 [Bacteroidetes bacterium]|nr:hypothetical protein [Bacteroidota bacterium]
MANIFNLDFQDFIRCFNDGKVEYVLLGGYAVILHGYPRTTGDMDIWVRKTPENYYKIRKAFAAFGMSIFDMTEANFLNNPAVNVFTFGVSPVSIDLMTAVKGLEFEAAFKNSEIHELEGLKVRVVHFNDLIQAKTAAGRAKDLNDIEHLKKKKKS